jgi:hypothetical protein
MKLLKVIFKSVAVDHIYYIIHATVEVKEKEMKDVPPSFSG